VRRPLESWAPARRRQAYVVVGALVLALVVLAGWAVVRVAAGGSSPVDQRALGPVVLVPGYGGDTSDLDPLVARLRAEGRQAIVFRPTGGEEGDLRVQARRLATLVKATLRRTGDHSVDLVGYSAGGVVVRLFVRDDGGAGLVRRVLTIGSPHHGTDVAATATDAVGSCPTACEQLVPGSELLDRLNAGDETPSGPRWTTLRSTSDTVVTPTESASLAGALNLLVQDYCVSSTTSHGALPGDPVTLAAVPAVLGRGHPHAPAHVHC
jgi:triacylglycerol esterase/lipase EstA (alpha/beta hydrolase family)